MNRIPYIFILCYCLLYTRASRAQHFPFFNLKVEHGLVQSQATCASQDDFGNLWVGTLGGLSRYDGKKITNFTVSDGLASNTILDIHEGADNRLYLNTAKGLQVFDGTHFTLLKIAKEHSGHDNFQICGVKQHPVFFLRDGMLYQIDPEDEHFLRTVAQKEAYSCVWAKQGVLIAATSHGSIYFLDETDPSKIIKYIPSSLQDISVLNIFEDHTNRIWLLTNRGLYFMKGQHAVPYYSKEGYRIEAPLLCATEDKKGHIWLGSVSGAYRLKDSSINYFNQKNGLSNNIIYNTLCDREGNIWFCTDGDGVFRYSGGPFISFDESFGLPSRQIISITGNARGDLFFASYQGKIARYKVGERMEQMEIAALSHEAINIILWQEKKGLWIAGRNESLYLYQDAQVKTVGLKGLQAQRSNITTLHKYHDGLLVGLSQNMLSIEKDQPSLIDLQNASVRCFADVDNDSVLIATNRGFYIYYNGATRKWGNRKLLDNFSVQCMVWNKGVLYIGTAENGIIVYNRLQDTFVVLNTKKGMSSDFIYNLLKDNKGNVWAGTGRGICSINTQKKRYSIDIYGKANGILGLESNSNAAFADPHGRLWFGTTEGISCFSPSSEPVLSQPISIVLESVKLFGGKRINPKYYDSSLAWYHIPKKLELPYRFNNLSFAFQAITLSPVNKIMYRYLLGGSSKNWSEWSEENTINFSALAPGSYTLRVMCAINGVPQDSPSLSYSFRIKTPFHKSIWFVISIFGLAILVGVLLQYMANRRKQKRMEREHDLRREEQSRVRERTAEDFHDEVGNKLTRITVLTDVLKTKIDPGNVAAERILQQIQDNTQQLYAGTRDILWSLQPSNDNLFELLNHVSDLATELFSETTINFSATGNQDAFKSYKMPLDRSRNFIMIWKEALNNCLKYAGATNVLLQVIHVSGAAIAVRLVDDGAGFDKQPIGTGNGLKNMQTRAKRLEAQIEVSSSRAKGTIVTLTLPEQK